MSTATATLSFEFVAHTPPPPPGHLLLGSGVTTCETAYFVFVEAAGPDDIDVLAARPVHVVFVNDRCHWIVDFADISPLPYLVDNFPDGRLLLAAYPGENRDTGALWENLTITSADGNVLARLHGGEAVSHVGIDHKQQVWLGYQDRGVFSKTIGRGGLVCLSAEGEVLWQFNRGSEMRDFIGHCYALNTTRGGVTAYYYDSFAAVSVTSDFEEVIRPETKIRGADALAVTEGSLVLSGGYTDPFNTLWRVPYKGRGFAAPEKVELLLPDGVPPLPKRSTFVGRGPRLHLLTDTAWYQADTHAFA